MLTKVVAVENLKSYSTLWVFKAEDLSLSRSESLLVGTERRSEKKMGCCCCVDSVSKWEIVGVVELDYRP